MESVVSGIEWKTAALADLHTIIDYIANDNPDAAQALLDAIRNRVAQLTRHPASARAGRVTGTRELIVRSNYIVIYAETVDAVTILRVLHAAQQWPEC